MKPAIELIAEIKKTGAQLAVHNHSRTLVVIGRIPPEMIDELDQRRDDILAIWAEHSRPTHPHPADAVEAALRLVTQA